MLGVSASPPSTFCYLQSKTQTIPHGHGLGSVNLCISRSSYIKLKTYPGPRFGTATRESHRISIRCNSSTGPGGPASGDSDSRSVLDAFFLGKALAEALSERVESTVGEFLSTIGRLQAEQQRQIEDFQEDVLQRAKRAKEKAAREALEAQGFIPKPTTVDTTAVNYGVRRTTSPSTIQADTPANSTTSTAATSPAAEMDPDPAAKGQVFGVSNDD